MKECTLCGDDLPDSVQTCPTCGTGADRNSGEVGPSERPEGSSYALDKSRALDDVARLASIVAKGQGSAETRRRFVSSMRDAEESIETLHRLLHDEESRYLGLVTPRCYSVVLSVPGAATSPELDAGARPLPRALDLIGQYSGTWSPFNLLAGGLYCHESDDGYDGLRLFGFWRTTATGLELEGFELGFKIEESDVTLAGETLFGVELDHGSRLRRLRRFSADVELAFSTDSHDEATRGDRGEPISASPSEPATAEVSDLHPDECRREDDHQRQDVVNREQRQTAFLRRVGGVEADGDPIEDLAEGVARAIQAAQDEIDEAEHRFKMSRRLAGFVSGLGPRALTLDELRFIDDRVRAAQQLSQAGLIEEPLQQYAAIVARHPSHVKDYCAVVQKLFRTHLWRRLTDVEEEVLYLATDLSFLTVVREQGDQLELDAGDWLRRGRELTLLGTQQRVLEWPEAALAPAGFEAIPPAAIPAAFRALMRFPQRPMTDDEVMEWLAGLAPMWSGRMARNKEAS